MELKFTTDWCTMHIPVWELHLAEFTGKPNLRFLEVGSWEGRSACWLLQNILTEPSSTLTCVDVFEPNRQLENFYAQHNMYIHSDPEEYFDHNIHVIGAEDRVVKHKGLSQHILRTLPLQQYDCIYIDGSHIAVDVFEDAVLSWKLLREGGLLIFDDYILTLYEQREHNPRTGIDAFLSIFGAHTTQIHSGWQLFLRKTTTQPQLSLHPAMTRTLLQSIERGMPITVTD